MTPERWEKIESIFQAALDLSGEEREQFVRAECGDDAELRAEVERFIARFETEDSFLESPVWTDSRFLQSQAKREIASSLDSEIVSNKEAKTYVGRQIGVYRLIKELGRGGMGEVFLAERADGEFNQKVAIKLIKRGMDTDFIVRRFRHERQIAAALNHPNIARLLDGGTTEDDLPYFVMEYVDGKPFFKYAETNELDLRRKLELFLQICRAIIYAHRKKIIHRDIKPGNILVSEDGEPKLLDFGIAKILDPDLIHESQMPQTATQMRLMTPEYASPEQARGDEITEASDQYSLGVLLYELLTGKRPYKFSSRAPHEIARVICEEIPSEPSSGEFGKAITENNYAAFDDDFCRKLDRIVLKALRKNPAERYASVQDFADDIERFLRNETVRAESFAGEIEKVELPPDSVKNSGATNIGAALTNKIAFQNVAPTGAYSGEKTISPRWKGVKQGLFLIILAILLVPIFTALIVSTNIPAILQFVTFVILFFGGIIRIVYALMMEPSAKQQLQNAQNSSLNNFNNKLYGADSLPAINSKYANKNYVSKPETASQKKSPSLDILSDAARYSLVEGVNHPLVASERTAPNSSQQIQTDSSEAKTIVQAIQPPRRLSWASKCLLAVFAVVLGLGLYHIISHTTIDLSATPPSQRWNSNFASAMNVKRLTVSGKARQAAVSPDGKNVAYISDDATRQSLWLQSVETGNAQPLVAPDAVFYTELSFSPDGKYVYYIVSRLPERTLYRISVGGGAPEKISENVLNLFALSPDGRRIVYDNQNSDNRQHSLYFAELDEKSQIKSAQTLFVLDLPNYFPGTITFSPDGNKIVYPRTTIEKNKEVINLFVYDFETKSNEKLGARDFNRINSTAWRAGGEEIVISASETDSAPHQLWVVNYPSGTTSRLTNDFTNYLGVSLTADASVLATTKIDEISNIWTSELSATNQNFESKTKQITGGFNRQDGRNGVNWTRDGRILYAGGAGAERGITLMNRDGTNSRPILTGATNPSFPSLTGDNRFLVFADKKGQELNIWRFDMSENALVQVSSRYAVTPTLAPDNRSIVYSMISDNSRNRLTIHRQPLDGGAETILTESLSVRPAVSPDGRFVACNYAGEETNDVWQIAVLPLDGNSAPRFIKPYTNKFFRSPQERPLAWSPDGRFLYFLNTADNVANIFRVSAFTDAPPVQMTHFTTGESFDFAIAPDGKSVVLSRGSVSSDVLIFKNTK
jgi:serine/threonine protein kinase/Tol biopolymer transport system component